VENINMQHVISTRDGDAAVIPLRARTLSEITTVPVDLDDLNSPHALAVLSVPPGSAVLDIGCGPGVVARALAARGCKVWGLELDSRRAAAARHHCIEVREADVEEISLSAAFPDMTFDAVLFLDVLEHLRDPHAALTQAAAVLAPGGSVLLSIPNVTHGALRLELLSGKFRYRPSGLLDRGHLRFFDAEGVDELIRQAGFRAETRLRVIRRLDQTEFDIDLASVPSALRTALENDVDALTYQFFVIAKPARGPYAIAEGMTLVERQRARIDELAAALEQGAGYARRLEEELAAKAGRMLEVEGAVATAGREIAARDARLREVEVTVANAAREAEARDARLAEIEQLLADRTRIFEDNESYVRHLEAELRKRAGDVAIRDDEMSVLRTHIERAERTISARDREIVDRDAALGVLRARLEDAEQSRELATQLSWVLQHPRHRLADKSAHVLIRRVPLIHRLLRALIEPALNTPPAAAGSLPHRGAD
jgi:SAM-dependent methyltransferase